MKKTQTLFKFYTAFVFVLLACVSGIFAQENEQRYVSETYKIAFQLPENSSKTASSTETSAIYEENASSGIGGLLNFEIGNQTSDILLKAMIGRNPAAESALVKVFSNDIKTAFEVKTVTVLEKKRIKIAGINSYKISLLFTTLGSKMRMTGYFIPVLEHKRVYSFKTAAVAADYARWSVTAEKAIFSFETLKKNAK